MIHDSTAKQLTVSVIVPVRDDVGGCRQVLASLARQTLARDQFDVIIAGDGAPAREIDALQTPDGRVKVVNGPPETSYAARNRGVAASRREVLAFCDSDCRPDPGWLAAGLEALAGADIAAGEVAFFPPDRPSLWTLLTVDTFLDQRRNAARARGVTANLFVRRRAFESWGPFDGALASGGDFEFVAGAVERGARLVYAPGAIVRHPTLDDRDSFLRKVWRTNRWAAIRRRRSGERPTAATFASCIPLAGAAFTRHMAARPVARLDAGRLRAAGIEVTPSREAAALAMYYLVVSQVANAARLSGWLTATRQPADSALDPAPRPGSSASEL